jgi:hypothetical protein
VNSASVADKRLPRPLGATTSSANAAPASYQPHLNPHLKTTLVRTFDRCRGDAIEGSQRLRAIPDTSDGELPGSTGSATGPVGLTCVRAQRRRSGGWRLVSSNYRIIARARVPEGKPLRPCRSTRSRERSTSRGESLTVRQIAGRRGSRLLWGSGQYLPWRSHSGCHDQSINGQAGGHRGRHEGPASGVPWRRPGAYTAVMLAEKNFGCRSWRLFRSPARVPSQRGGHSFCRCWRGL